MKGDAQVVTKRMKQQGLTGKRQPAAGAGIQTKGTRDV